jgi:hypothetical protein
MLQAYVQVFQVFLTYVANILSRCFKSRSWCCTCCNGNAHMFQVLQIFHLDVLKLIWCCTYCYGYTHMFETHVSSISSVLDVCCKCFIWIFLKIDLGEAHVVAASALLCHRACLLVLLLCSCGRVKWSELGWSACMRGPAQSPKRDGRGARELRSYVRQSGCGSTVRR